MDTNLHAVSDNSRRPVHFFITAGQGRNHTDAAALKNRLPEAGQFLADRGYDADWFREGFTDKETHLHIPECKMQYDH